MQLRIAAPINVPQPTRTIPDISFSPHGIYIIPFIGNPPPSGTGH